MCDNPTMSAHHFFRSVLLTALLVTGCGGLTDPSKNQVDPFSGTVPVGGAGPVHVFNVSKTGELSMRITALSPTPTAVVTVVYGQAVTGGCAPLSQNDFVGLNTGDTFQFQIQKGSWCAQVADPYTRLAVAQNYTLQVSHP
jgi:hypothetical protein